MSTMNPEVNETGSSDLGRGRANKTEKTRRNWTSKGEAVLIASLKELVANGWKADNGFRAGYLSKLEDAMRKAFPDTDLKGLPHINSKISAWKKSYNSLMTMLGNSGLGVGFNTRGTFMIDCDNDQWDQIVKKDSNAKLMRYKSCPMLEDWKEVFGKDRATGEHAADCMDAYNELVHDINVAEAEAQGTNNVQHGDENDDTGADDSVCQSSKSTGKVRGTSKKRKNVDGLEGVYAVLAELNRTTDKRLEILASRIGYEFDLANARKEAFEHLNRMSGLGMDAKFDACELLAFKVERLQIFMCLPDDARSLYVMRLLQQGDT